ncbi:hypothetical protein IE81DRAFT_137309 [Ceraceosorus guamensis]|uniref:ARID domain-containing protein n=1 Tax=Ceraceosorus guamensis TaxID=1522189 RepID=A0A316W0N9_9BASI|nr:hypothetical protein IE81DRAFT_137309 [Ceraceosorus guamensis]PWN42293.1 hypothetical protein IE81DRAFT_137309 [Ceraceosorus guamensis]
MLPSGINGLDPALLAQLGLAPQQGGQQGQGQQQSLYGLGQPQMPQGSNQMIGNAQFGLGDMGFGGVGSFGQTMNPQQQQQNQPPPQQQQQQQNQFQQFQPQFNQFGALTNPAGGIGMSNATLSNLANMFGQSSQGQNYMQQQQQQQQQPQPQHQPQQQQFQANQQRPASAQGQQQGGQTGQSQPYGQAQPQGARPNVPQGISNPYQSLQALQSSMQTLQRQWQTVAGHPDSPQKQNAQQQLATQIKRIKATQAGVLQMIQNSGQAGQLSNLSQQMQAAQQGSSMPTQQQQQQAPPPHLQHQQGAQQGQAQPQQQQQQQSFPQQPQQAGTSSQPGQGPPVGDGAHHQDQLAALQAFAQRQRNAQHPNQPRSGTPQQGFPGAAASQGNQQPSQGVQGLAAGPAGGAAAAGPQPPRDFLGTVRAFMSSKGTPLPQNMSMTFVGPSLNSSESTRSVDLQNLFASIVGLGGSARIGTVPNGWALAAQRLNLATHVSHSTGMANLSAADIAQGVPPPNQVADRLMSFYKDRLGSFEEFWMQRMRGASGQAQPQTQANQQSGPAGGQQQLPLHQLQQQQQQQQQKPPNGQSIVQPPSDNTTSQQPAGQAPDNASAPLQNVTMAQASAMVAALPGHMQQLSAMVQAQRITPEQARQRAAQLQAASQRAVQLAQEGQARQNQAHAQQPSSTPQQPPQSTPSGQTIQQQQQQLQQPPQQQGPLQAQIMQPPPTPQNAAFEQQAQLQRPQEAVPTAPPGGQAEANKTKAESKRPAKKPRKSTASVELGPSGEVPAPPTVPHESGAPSTQTSSGMPSDAAAQQALATHQIQQAHAAMQALQHGNLSKQQQQGALAAIKTAFPKLDPPTQARAMSIAQTVTSQIATPPDADKSEGGAPASADAGPDVPPSSLADAVRQQQAKQAATGGPQLAPGLGSAAAAALAEVPLSAADVSNQRPFYKIEYMPIRRDLKSFGGWDLDHIQDAIGTQLEGRGKVPRHVRELGHVDVGGLTMSLRSRLEIEVAYALNALRILSSGSGSSSQVDFIFPLGSCDDLLDELVELLEDSVLGRSDEELELLAERPRDDTLSLASDGPTSPGLSHREWIDAVLEEQQENQVWRRKRLQGAALSSGDANTFRLDDHSDSDEEVLAVEEDADGLLDLRDSAQDVDARSANERRANHFAATSIAVLEILRNLAMMTENNVVIAEHPRALSLLARICSLTDAQVKRRFRQRLPEVSQEDEEEEVEGEVRTVLTLTEALRVRKDILEIIATLACDHIRLASLGPSASVALFELIAGFIVDAGDIEEKSGGVYDQHSSTQPVARKVPQHADIALEAFSRFAQPDENREVLSALLSSSRVLQFTQVLVKLLPVSDLDFQLMRTEPRLAYNERLAMSLYNMCFLAPPKVKSVLRSTPGVIKVLFRVINRLAYISTDFSMNPFGTLIARLVEALRLISDAADSFAAASFGGPASRQSSAGSAVLIEDLMNVLEILAFQGIDPVIVSELESMIHA